MKTKKEILQNYIDGAEETLIKIGIRHEYFQNRYARENKQAHLQELAQLTSDRKETEDWLVYLKEQTAKT